MKLSNTESFSGTPLRETARTLIESCFESIDTKESIARRVSLQGTVLMIDQEPFDLGSGRVVVVGAGKCSGDALAAFAEILGERLTVGFVIDVVQRHIGGRCEVVVGDHPFPSERNELHTKRLLSLLSHLSADDFVLFLVSGGGTVLLAQPPFGFSVADETALIKLLFAGGATIQEMNTVRKHLSLARGGFLAKAASPAQSLSVIFSDVPGNDISFISSGPTVKDETSISDARAILEKYGTGVEEVTRASSALIETPKEDTYFQRAQHRIFMSNDIALKAMSATAIAKGFIPRIITNKLQGNARDVGQQIAGEIASAPSKTCLLYGGETTVIVEGHGSGGRNRHLVLSALPMVHDDCLVAAFASDGIDNGPRAGAFADSGILASARQQELDPWKYVANNNSHEFFERTGGSINSGPTGSNVADLIFALKL